MSLENVNITMVHWLWSLYVPPRAQGHDFIFLSQKLISFFFTTKEWKQSGPNQCCGIMLL